MTGSTAGIGRAIAVEFAREGAAVVVTGRDATRGAAVVAEITAAGGAAEFVAADIADETECVRLVATAVDTAVGLVDPRQQRGGRRRARWPASAR